MPGTPPPGYGPPGPMPGYGTPPGHYQGPRGPVDPAFVETFRDLLGRSAQILAELEGAERRAGTPPAAAPRATSGSGPWELPATMPQMPPVTTLPPAVAMPLPPTAGPPTAGPPTTGPSSPLGTLTGGVSMPQVDPFDPDVLYV